MTLRETYKRISSCLNGVGLGECVEPYAHVEEVENLRLEYKPELVRFLIVAESHVRSSEARFSTTGPGLVFNARHRTTWWKDLLSPGFGGRQSGDAHYRQQCLKRLRDSGFWVLDASILSLSGYQKVQCRWGKRPLDEFQEQVLRDSWAYYTGEILDSILNQKIRPVVVIYTRVLHMLGEQLCPEIADSPQLKFRVGSNNTRYETEGYAWGTSTFREAARRAGLEQCLRDIPA